MKKAMLLAACLLAAGLPALAWEGGFSLSVSPSPLYAWTWSPAVAGSALSLDAGFPTPIGSLRVGLEAGIGGLGAELLLPLGLAEPLWIGRSRSLRVDASGILGLALFKPAPLFMVGAEAGIAWNWFWGPHWGLEGRAALRYLSCPAYSAQVARYEVVNLPLSIALRYRSGP